MSPSEQVYSGFSGRARGLWRLIVLAVLFVGPATAFNIWAKHETGLIPYFQQGYRYRLDAKKIMFQQVDCPSSIALGTSMTEVALNAESIAPYRSKSHSDLFEPIFTFAAPGTRPIAMHGTWRWLRKQGCKPEFLFVEVTPVILNVARGEDFERAFMDLKMQWDVSERRFDKDIYTLKFRANLATWWRIFTFRNREPINKFFAGWFGAKKTLEPKNEIPSDGKLKPTSDKELKGAFLKSQYRNTLKTFKNNEFKFEFSHAYVDTLLALAEEAGDEGTRVIFHTPPVPDMHREFMDIAKATVPFCDFYNKVHSMPELRWYSEYGASDIAAIDFSDWLHVNHGGAIKYANRILSAVAADNFPVDDYCRQR